MLHCVDELSALYFGIDNLQLLDLIMQRLPEFTALANLRVINGHRLASGLERLAECQQRLGGVGEQGDFLEVDPSSKEALNCIEPATTDEGGFQLIRVIQVAEYFD